MRHVIVVLCILLSACSVSPQKNSVDIDSVARSYFNVYAQRSDFERFMNFYANDAVLKDIIYGNELIGKENIRAFFDWQRGGFSVVKPGPILEVQRQVVSGNTVITRGIFKAFKYNGVQMGPWQFVIWQEFNSVGQVIHQQDWINYTPKKILIGG